MTKAFMAAWRSLKPRERWVVTGGATLVVSAVFYLYAWEPMSKEAAALREELPEGRQAAEWMRQKQPEAVRLKSAVESAVKAGADIEAFTKKTFEDSGSQNVRVKKLDNDKASVTVDSIEPKTLFMIIEKLRKEGLITVTSLKVEPLPDDKNAYAEGVFVRVAGSGA